MSRDARAGASLRIVGGALSGRRFGRPESVTRPTSDRVREAVASILSSRTTLEGAHVLELFAGTGAYAFELLSRGAGRAVLVERDPRAARDIEASAVSLGLSDRTTIVRADVSGARALEQLRGDGFDLVIADPPYDAVSVAVEALGRLLGSERLRPGALLVLEHRTSDAARVDQCLRAPATSSRLSVLSRYRYGETTISLLELRGAAPTEHAPNDRAPDAASDPESEDR
jgi:16S rRNA (guanine966-N2)-methyltransferase